MDFYLSKEQFKELLNICRNNKKEVSGKIRFIKEGDKYNFQNYKMNEKNIIFDSNKTTISFNLQELLQDLVFDTYSSNDDVYVIFHTHPGFIGAAGLSDEDREFLKYVQEIANQVTRSDGNKSAIQVVSGVICRDKIGFYYYDTNSKGFKRTRTYVNGIEIIPDLEADGSEIKHQGSWNSSRKAKSNKKRDEECEII